MKKTFNWKIAGKAGDGVMVISKLLAKAVKRHGWYAFSYLEYPSLIKGGHQTGQVFASPTPNYSQRRKLDVLVAVNKNALKEHKNEITDKTLVIYNSNDGALTDNQPKKIIELPLADLARESAGTKMVMNVVSLGLSTHLLGLNKEIVWQVIADEFGGKGEKILEKNKAAFEKGYEIIQDLSPSLFEVEGLGKKEDDQILLTGNEAIGMGAIAAGMQYYSAYPMTPASGLMHYLASQQENPLIVKHVEDEIAAVNQALGASFAGVRVMTGTSGGGFALMVEGLSLAGITELPLVISYGMRPGPATGLPTWTSQGDLQFVLRAGHGEFQRVVLTPGTVEDHFELTQKAFELAEKYQIPVFILSDKYILESHQTMKLPKQEIENKRHGFVAEQDLKEDDSYRRYAVTDSGVSPRSVPGQAHGLQVTNSYEHDEFGYAVEDAEATLTQVHKRAKKFDGLVKEIPKPVLFGASLSKSKVTFVSWGSTLNVLIDVVNSDEEIAKKISVIHLPCVWPFPTEEFTKMAKESKKLVMVEGNMTGQAEDLIRQETGIEMSDSIRRHDGRPFYMSDILQWVKENI